MQYEQISMGYSGLVHRELSAFLTLPEQKGDTGTHYPHPPLSTAPTNLPGDPVSECVPGRTGLALMNSHTGSFTWNYLGEQKD